jgi:hypothetical protein
MTAKVVLILGAVLVGGCVWMLVPAFPAPERLIDSSLIDLTNRFGPGREITPDSRAFYRPAKSVAWDKTRGIALWTLRADWYHAPKGPVAHPDSVSRCMRLIWGSESLSDFLPCEVVATARVMASNYRLERP